MKLFTRELVKLYEVVQATACHRIRAAEDFLCFVVFGRFGNEAAFQNMLQLMALCVPSNPTSGTRLVRGDR